MKNATCSLFFPKLTLILIFEKQVVFLCKQLHSNVKSGTSVKNLPAVQEMWVQPLGQEDPLEKEMATHSSILACGIPWTEEPGELQSMGLQRVRHD